MRTNKIISMIILFCMVLFLSNTNRFISLAKTNNASITESQYRSTLQLILHPYIQEEVHNRYGKYAYVDIYDITFESIIIQSPIDITIDVIIQPYTGPHNTISTDKITLHVDDNQVQIINYSPIR
jgi:hypothetical protein